MDYGGGDDGARKDDDAVEIEREDSAWDALRGRLVDAAAAGRVVDLTEEQGGTTSTVADAVADFDSLPAPQDPSSIVPAGAGSATATGSSTSTSTSTSTSNTGDGARDPRLDGVQDALRVVLTSLQRAREKLRRAASDSGGAGRAPRDKFVCYNLDQVNERVDHLQRKINAVGERLYLRPRLVEAVQKLNLVVSKANIIIFELNRHKLERLKKSHRVLGKRPKRGGRRGDPGGARGKRKRAGGSGGGGGGGREGGRA